MLAFNFKCKHDNCQVEFPVEMFRLKNKTEVVCPNCGNKFPEDNFKKLQEVAEAYIAARKLQSSWSFKIIE